MNRPFGSSPRELIGAAALLLLSVWIWYYSNQFPDLPEGYPGPKLFPRLIAMGLAFVGIGLGASYFLSGPQKADSKPQAEGKSRIRLIFGILLLAIFPILSPLAGFIPSLLVIGFLLGLSLKVNWYKAMLTAATTVLGIYFIFSELLNVPL